VIFKEGGKTLYTGDLILVDGVPTATFKTSNLSAGRHSITASYSGDPNFKTSTSPAAVETVAKAGTATGVNVSVRQSVFGQEVTITATVTPTSEVEVPPTRKVTFKDGKQTLGTVDVTTVNGVTTATLRSTKLAVGDHTITASYAGDGNFSGSVSGTVTETVVKADTTTTLNSLLNPSSLNQKVTFIARVSVGLPGSGEPTGVVTFYDGGTKLGTGTLRKAGGVTTATFSTTKLAAGDHTITASYAGDKNFNASVSEALTQTVQNAASIASPAFDRSDAASLITSAATGRSDASRANDAALAGLMAQWRLRPLQPGLAPVKVAGAGTVLSADPPAGAPFEDDGAA
jgi:hypothetical protein